jgi:kynurenine formamidase
MSLGTRDLQFDTEQGIDLSIPLDFSASQPRHFGVSPATAAPLRLGNFVGDVAAGGGCNCSEIRIVPHCNGTHTESVRHVTTDGPYVTATVITVAPVAASDTGDSYVLSLASSELVITADRLQQTLSSVPHPLLRGLIVRTLPNSPEKRWRDSAKDPPPFFSREAMTWLSSLPVAHLVVDIPSVDREEDGGRLANHRIFWNLPTSGFTTDPQTRRERTITEMAFIPSSLPDGPYLLGLQVAPFLSDAAPSRPVVYPSIPTAS